MLPLRVRHDGSALRFNVVHSNNRCSGDRRDQLLELIVLAVLYVLQVFNAEMLRRAIGFNGNNHLNPTEVTRLVEVLANRLHPLAMVIFGAWLVLMAMQIARAKRLPRWTFDILGLWFTIRLALEFVTINLLIYEPSFVPPGVLLGQIVVYLPFFVLAWGWIFHRLDWVDRDQAGIVIQLIDADPVGGVSRFDYFHATINTLLNKGKPMITGVSRTGRIIVLIFNGMLLGLYAVAFARILQLTKMAV